MYYYRDLFFFIPVIPIIPAVPDVGDKGKIFPGRAKSDSLKEKGIRWTSS